MLCRVNELPLTLSGLSPSSRYRGMSQLRMPDGHYGAWKDTLSRVVLKFEPSHACAILSGAAFVVLEPSTFLCVKKKKHTKRNIFSHLVVFCSFPERAVPMGRGAANAAKMRPTWITLHNDHRISHHFHGKIVRRLVVKLFEFLLNVLPRDGSDGYVEVIEGAVQYVLPLLYTYLRRGGLAPVTWPLSRVETKPAARGQLGPTALAIEVAGRLYQIRNLLENSAAESLSRKSFFKNESGRCANFAIELSGWFWLNASRYELALQHRRTDHDCFRYEVRETIKAEIKRVEDSTEAMHLLKESKKDEALVQEEALKVLLSSAEKKVIAEDSDEHRIATKMVELCERVPSMLAIAGGMVADNGKRFTEALLKDFQEKQATRLKALEQRKEEELKLKAMAAAKGLPEAMDEVTRAKALARRKQPMLRYEDVGEGSQRALNETVAMEGVGLTFWHEQDADFLKNITRGMTRLLGPSKGPHQDRYRGTRTPRHLASGVMADPFDERFRGVLETEKSLWKPQSGPLPHSCPRKQMFHEAKVVVSVDAKKKYQEIVGENFPVYLQDKPIYTPLDWSGVSIMAPLPRAEDMADLNPPERNSKTRQTEIPRRTYPLRRP